MKNMHRCGLSSSGEVNTCRESTCSSVVFSVKRLTSRQLLKLHGTSNFEITGSQQHNEVMHNISVTMHFLVVKMPISFVILEVAFSAPPPPARSPSITAV